MAAGMKNEFWLEILVGVIILGTLAFLSIKVWDMSGKLSSVDATATFTADRVSRIAAALPDVGIRIAREELARAIQTVVLSTNPHQTANGGWQVAVTVLDTQSSKKWTLPVRLNSKDDRKTVDALLGIGVEMDRDFLSLSRLQEFSSAAHLVDASVPNYVDAKASFVLYNTNGKEFVSKITSRLGQETREAAFDMKVEDYMTLIKALQAEQDAFMTPKK
jgi:hypothetical protein